MTDARASWPSGPTAQDGERRQVTVLFCDLVGSSRLAGQLDPEDFRDLLRAYQARCVEAVHSHGGFVAQYLGDGIVAYFGHPTASEDAPEQAVRAAQRILKGVADLVIAGERLQARAGIASGLAVVGDVLGSGMAEQTAITGQVAILAARIQSLSTPGVVAIADSTRRLIGAVFDTTDQGVHQLAGLADPVRIWSVGLEQDHPSRFEAVRTGDGGEMVGRRRELAVLRERWLAATRGACEVVLLTGEAGIGKSALVRTLRDEIEREGGASSTLQCSSRHAQSPFHPMTAYLQRMAGWARADDPDTRFAKLAALLDREEVGWGAGALADLMAIEGANLPPAPREAHERKRQTMAVLLDLLRRAAGRSPILIVLEDAHWADPSTLELIGEFLTRQDLERLLLVVTTRIDHPTPWSRGRTVTSLTLPRLEVDEARRLVGQIAEDRLSAEVIDQILGRSEGVPLFLEELARATLEAGDTRTQNPSGRIPATLQDGLAARLDRLGHAKITAQVAAVLGRTFDPQTLAGVLDRDPTDDLAQLIDAKLVRRSRQGVETFAFTHALLQEAAYDSLLRNTRRQLHARAATVIEAQGGTAAAEPEILAHHCEQAAQHARAAGFWLVAGQRAQARAANAEAIAHLRRGLAALAEARDRGEHQSLEFELWLGLGQTTYVLKGPAHPDTIAAYEQAQELVAVIPDPDQRCRVLYGIFSGYHFASKLDLAEGPARRLLEFATAGDRRADLCQAHRMLGYVAFFRGDHRGAIDHFDTLARLYRHEDHGARAYQFGADCLVATQAFHAVIESLSGPYAAATARVDTNRALAASLDHPASLGWAYAAACYVRYFGGDVAGALVLGDEGAAYCEVHGVGAWYPHCRLFAIWAIARTQGHEGCAEEVRTLIAQTFVGNRLGICLFRIVLAEILLIAGDSAAALAEAEAASEEINQTGQRIFEPAALLLRARCLRAAGAPADGVRAAYEVAAELSQQAGAFAIAQLALAEMA